MIMLARIINQVPMIILARIINQHKVSNVRSMILIYSTISLVLARAAIFVHAQSHQLPTVRGSSFCSRPFPYRDEAVLRPETHNHIS